MSSVTLEVCGVTKWPVGCGPSKSPVAHGQRGSHAVT